MLHCILFAVAPLFSTTCLGTIIGPVIEDNFPDPCVIYSDGTWYAFSTNNGVYNIPVATSTDFETWTVLDQDALPDAGVWSGGTNVWAPDVIQLVSPIQSDPNHAQAQGNTALNLL